MAKFFLKNPGFELGDQEWVRETGWSIVNDAANARNGAWVSRFSGNTPNSIRQQVDLNVRPGSAVSMSAWIDGSAATAGLGRIHYSWLDYSGVLVSSFFSPGISSGQPGYVNEQPAAQIAPDRVKFIRMQVRISGSPNGTIWFADDADATGDIIESIPTSANISSYRVVPADTVGVFDPLVGPDKFTEFNAGMSDKWGGVYSFIPSLGGDLGELVSFIRRIGRTDRFFAFDPARTVPLNGVVNGMTVDGATTQGTNRIPVTGGPVSSTALVAGDYIEVKDQYFQLQRDLEIGPESTGEAIVWPAVRSTLADGEDVITNNPKMVARITSDLDWRGVEANPVGITISWEEV